MLEQVRGLHVVTSILSDRFAYQACTHTTPSTFKGITLPRVHAAALASTSQWADVTLFGA